MLESLQRQIESQVARHTEAITSSLAQIEPALNRIRQQQAEASASANRTILIAAGLFAVAGFFGLGFLTMASVRAMGRFTDVAVNATTRKPLAVPVEPPATALAASPPVVSGSVEQASARFQGALEQLERRIKELEHTSHATPAPSLPDTPSSGATAAHPSGNGPGRIQALSVGTLSSTTAAASAEPPSHVDLELGKGQALMNLDQIAEALECFDRALSDEPNNTDALLRKGMALERLQDWERALECYERAILLDDSLTVAYLYKGGVCNRLERHREALDSYERALRSERERTVSP